MAKDKYTAVWVSHTSISDYLACPRSYYLKNVYKDPDSKNKIQVVAPPLSLGQVVHEILEGLSVVPTPTRFSNNILDQYEEAWERVRGKQGGFLDKDTEYRYFQRGREMIKRVLANPGPLKEKAVKINMDLPYFWLSEDQGIILCGKIDWLEYIEARDSVHIIDFKTGKSKESADSLQLPIYMLLVHECQKRAVEKISYWYLETDDAPVAQELPDLENSRAMILELAQKIKVARSLEKYDCPTDGCRACDPYEAILRGEAEFVGVGTYNQDLYLVTKQELEEDEQADSRIL